MTVQTLDLSNYKPGTTVLIPGPRTPAPLRGKGQDHATGHGIRTTKDKSELTARQRREACAFRGDIKDLARESATTEVAPMTEAELVDWEALIDPVIGLDPIYASDPRRTPESWDDDDSFQPSYLDPHELAALDPSRSLRELDSIDPLDPFELADAYLGLSGFHVTSRP